MGVIDARLGIIAGFLLDRVYPFQSPHATSLGGGAKVGKPAGEPL